MTRKNGGVTWLACVVVCVSYKDKRYAPDKSWLAEERRRALPLIESIVDRMDQEIRLEQLQQRMLAIQVGRRLRGRRGAGPP